MKVGPWPIHSLRLMFTVFLVPKIAMLCWWAISRSDFGRSWVFLRKRMCLASCPRPLIVIVLELELVLGSVILAPSGRRCPRRGRAKFRLSRGFPLGPAQQHHPPQFLARII
jgi:hypothetical protein